jgi:hypothetical protein
VSRPAGNELPAGVRELLDGSALERATGPTVLLLTVDDTGWPRVAMLSAGEVLAAGPREVRVALWPDSRTTANLAATGRATLALVHAGAGWYLRCAAGGRADLAAGGGRSLAAFVLTVEETLEDVVPYAELVSGVAFRLTEPDRVLPVWREVVRALRDMPPPI